MIYLAYDNDGQIDVMRVDEEQWKRDWREFLINGGHYGFGFLSRRGRSYSGMVYRTQDFSGADWRYAMSLARADIDRA